MIKQIFLIMLAIGSGLLAEPTIITDQFVSTLTARKYFKYDALQQKYVEFVRQDYVDGNLKNVNYVASYVNNDKYWVGKYSSFGSGGFSMNGINYDFYTEESYYIIRLVTNEPIESDVEEARYALDMCFDKYFTDSPHGETNIELLQLPWTFSELYEQRDKWTYNPNDIFEEIKKSPVVGEFKIRKMQNMEKFGRIFLKNLKQNEVVYDFPGFGKQYEYGMFTVRVKDEIDFTKCGGVSDYKLVQGGVNVTASITDENGNEISGLKDGIILNICINNYTTPGHAWTISDIKVQHRSLLEDQLPPESETGVVVCPNEGCFMFHTGITHCVVKSAFQLFASLSIIQAGVAGEIVYFEGKECGGVAPQMAYLSDKISRNILRSQGVVGYILDYGDGQAVEYPSSPVSHTYANPGTYIVRAYCKLKVQEVDINGRPVGYSYPIYEIQYKTIRVRSLLKPKSAVELRNNYGFLQRIVPTIARLMDETVCSIQDEAIYAWNNVAAGQNYNINPSAKVLIQAPEVSLLPGYWAMDGADVRIISSLPVLARKSLAEPELSLQRDASSDSVPDTLEIGYLERNGIMNRPNPFNPSTMIYCFIGRDKRVEVSASLKIYNVRGVLVKTIIDGRVPAGAHAFCWDAKDGNGITLAGGVYFCEYKDETCRRIRKMVLAR